MIERRLLKICTWSLFIAVVGMPFFYLSQGVYPYTLAKTLLFQIPIEFFIGAWIGLMVCSEKYRPRRSTLLITLTFFIGCFIFVSALGVDPWRSFWSTQERAVGTVLVVHLALMAYAISSLINHINWRKLFMASIATSATASLLAILQLYIPNLLLVENVGGRPGATFGNPTFFAGYLDFHIFLALWFAFSYAKERSTRSAWLFGLLAIGETIVLFITQTRGDILGVGAGIAVLLCLFAYRPIQFGPSIFRKRSFYVSIVGIGFILGGCFWITRTSAIWESVPGLNRFQDISLTSLNLQPRLVALRAAWEGFRERPIFGWGPDNFNIVFNKHYDPKLLEINYQETRFDKPHNLFMEYLVTGGIFLSLAFLVLIIALGRSMLSLREHLLGEIFFASLIAYLIRSIFVFDTIGPLVMLYLLIGVTDGLRRVDAEPAIAIGQNRNSKQGAHRGGDMAFVVWAPVGVAVILAYVLNVMSLEATYHQYYGYKYFQAGRPDKAIASFKKAVGIFTPYAWMLKRDYAKAVAEAYFYNPGKISQDEARRAVSAMEETAKEHPQDSANHYALVDMYNQIQDIDPTYYLSGAEREAKIALDLSPNRQEVYFSLAKTKTIQEDYVGALKLLKYALDLNPNVADAHFYYGLVAYAAEKPDLGYAELKQAIALGKTWKNYAEPRVVANFFADSEHLDEAIDLYKISLEMHEDSEVQLKLGVAYFFKKDYEHAREYIQKGLKSAGPDIESTPTYQYIIPILQQLGVR